MCLLGCHGTLDSYLGTLFLQYVDLKDEVLDLENNI